MVSDEDEQPISAGNALHASFEISDTWESPSP